MSIFDLHSLSPAAHPRRINFPLSYALRQLLLSSFLRNVTPTPEILHIVAKPPSLFNYIEVPAHLPFPTNHGIRASSLKIALGMLVLERAALQSSFGTLIVSAQGSISMLDVRTIHRHSPQNAYPGSGRPLSPRYQPVIC